MRWSNRRQLLILQRALVVNEADIRGIGMCRRSSCSSQGPSRSLCETVHMQASAQPKLGPDNVGRPCAGLRRIKLPPPPGVSQGLRDWMTETGEFLKQGKRLQKLKRLREERLEQELAAKQAGAARSTACVKVC